MLTITDIGGNTEALTGYRGLRRKRNVNGEKTLAFLVLPTEQNAHSYPMVSEESVVEFDGEPYRIKQLAEKSKGTTFYKEVVAVHTFFDLIDEHVYTLNTGSMTFESALHFVLDGTEYTWSTVDTFYAQDFENFGDENRLALFQTLLERYGAEFTLNGTHITFRERIGNATDFQFRYNYNVKTITRDVKTSNLSTYIKGYGKQNTDGTYVVESEYTSPNASIFGIRHAKPVRDERYITLEGLNARLQAEINDEPEVSITIDFADLRRAGFPYDIPSEGDDVFLIYEPIGIDVEARLVDIDEEFTEGSDLPIKTTVTLGNIRDSVVDRWAHTEKQINGIIGGDGKIRYNALDAAVKRATSALLSAETELEFENGIIARDKNNPNFLVLFNSNGIGISRDGGQTFKEALTSEGFVASAGVIGQFEANNIQIGPETTFSSGYDPSVLQSDGEFLVNTKQLILNSTFNTGEDGKGGWSSWKSNWTNTKLGGTSRTFEGVNTAKFTVTGLTADEWREIKSNRIKTATGRTYTLSVYSEVDDLTTFDQGFSAEFEWWDVSGVRIQANSFSLLPSQNGTWERKIGRATAPTGAVEMNVRFHPNRNGVGWIAKPMLTEGTLVVPHAEASDAANIVREDLRMTAPLPTSITMNQDGIRASTSDPTRYAQVDYRGLFVKKGAIQVERPDGALFIEDGLVKMDFSVMPTYPADLINTHQGTRHYVSERTIEQNDGFIGLYTFRKVARYLEFELALSSSTVSYAALFKVIESGTNTQLGAIQSYEILGNETVKKLRIDLGVPDFSEYAVRALLLHNFSGATAYCRIIRIRQTDF